MLQSNSVGEKLFWVLIILGCGFVSIINTDIMLAGYLSNRSTTKITFVPVRLQLYQEQDRIPGFIWVVWLWSYVRTRYLANNGNEMDGSINQ